jgi:hypothetical protein
MSAKGLSKTPLGFDLQIEEAREWQAILLGRADDFPDYDDRWLSGTPKTSPARRIAADADRGRLAEAFRGGSGTLRTAQGTPMLVGLTI